MTVSTDLNRVSFAGDGSTTAFDLGAGFIFFEETELRVIIRTDSTGAEELQTLTTDYTVTGGDGSTGTVTMVTAPASGETLVIRRVLPLTQGTDYENNSASDAENVETSFDKLTLMVQQLSEELDRSLKFAETSTAADIDYPDPEANKIPMWNAAGDALENRTQADIDTVTVTAFMETLLDDPDAATGRNTLGASSGDWPVTHGGTGASDAATARTNLAVPGTGAANTFTEPQTLKSTQNDALVHTALKLLRDRTSADNDVLEAIDWVGKNDAGTPEDITFARSYAKILDNTDATEDGILYHDVKRGGSDTAIYHLLGEQRFTSSGTYTPTPGTRAILVEVVGAGGAGGGVSATAAGEEAGGAGGGGGGYSRKLITTVPPSATITIGSGGSGSSAASGGAGSDSSYADGTETLTGSGGSGGQNGGAVSGNINATGGAGGGASGGDINISGSGGGAGGTKNGSRMLTGFGGNSQYSGIQQPPGDAAGVVGINYGGGGSGATANPSDVAKAGGDGAPGIVIITEYA